MTGSDSQDDGSHHGSHDDGYAGPADLLLAGRSVPVTVRLAGFFEPVEGRFRWYGRAWAIDAADAEVVGVGAKTPARLVTPHGSADVLLGDTDFWGRPRIWGQSAAPFEVNRSL